MAASRAIEDAARARIGRNREMIQHSMAMWARGTPLAAETDPDRLTRRLQAKAGFSGRQARALAESIYADAKAASGAERAERGRAGGGPERIYGDTVDFVGVAFLDRGFATSRAVVRIVYPDGRPLGTGFMVSDRLLITNNHVIGSDAEAQGLVAEFDYELGLDRRARPSTQFGLDPGAFFHTSPRDDLDFTLVALGERRTGT